MEQEQLVNTIEALLFAAGKPLKAKDFAKILEQDEANIKLALNILVEQKKDAGIVLLDNKGEYQFTTNSKYSTAVKNFLNAELREKLTDATVEVLAIIAYRQPISKAEIEAIRGVNSQYSLRNLLMRGLIEKVSNPADARSLLYQTTTEFLMHLGINSVTALPEFEKLVSQIKLPKTAGLAQGEPAPAMKEAVIDEINTAEPSAAEPAEISSKTPEQPEVEEFEEDDDEDEDDSDDEE